MRKSRRCTDGSCSHAATHAGKFGHTNGKGYSIDVFYCTKHAEEYPKSWAEHNAKYNGTWTWTLSPLSTGPDTEADTWDE